MRRSITISAAILAASFAISAPASAGPALFDKGLGSPLVATLVTPVQYYGPGYGYGYGRRYYYGQRRGFPVGAGVAAGLAAGALLGGAIIASQPRPVYAGPIDGGDGGGGGGEVEYCASRYRSYDPSSGTYLGFDGMRHPCP